MQIDSVGMGILTCMAMFGVSFITLIVFQYVVYGSGEIYSMACRLVRYGQKRQAEHGVYCDPVSYIKQFEKED